MKRELPRLIVQWSLECDPVVTLDVLGQHDECQLADWLAENRHELCRRFEERLAEMQARCEQAAGRDLGGGRRAA